MIQVVLFSIVIGVIATICMDVWQVFLRIVARIPSTDWRTVARWFGYMLQGKFVHEHIENTLPIKNELPLGWFAHYAVGITYSFIFLLMSYYGGYFEPVLASTLAFGLITLVIPWFIVQPAVGMGLMASKAEKTPLVIAYNVLSHTAFGLGMYLGLISLNIA